MDSLGQSFQDLLLHVPPYLQRGVQSPTHIALALLALIPIAVILRMFYNVFLHPLSKYPGPPLAASGDLVYHYYLTTGNLLTWVRAQHAAYGEAVRLGPARVSYIDPQAWKDIYGHRTGGRKPNIKSPNFFDIEYEGQPSIVSELDESEHGRVRRIFSHAFSDKALKEQQPLLLQYVDKLVNNVKRDIAKQPDRHFNAVELYNFTTFDIMGDLTFGEALGLLENGTYSDWVRNIFGGLRSMAILSILRDYPTLGNIYRALEPKSIKELRKNHSAYSSERVNRRLKVEREQPDIWNLVLRQPEGRGLTLKQMHANASTFMIAGTETTATLLSGLTYHLLRNPDKMRKLVGEIRGAFESDEQLTIENLQKLKYMAACLEEALRCYPPVASGMWRVTPPEGTAICGKWVPGNTRVCVSHYAAYSSPVNFKDPQSFVPERWLPGTGYDSDRKEVLQPFSAGPRNCIGKNLAYHEMRLILAKMLWNFDYTLCPESSDWTDQKAYVLWEKHPLMIQISPVQR